MSSSSLETCPSHLNEVAEIEVEEQPFSLSVVGIPHEKKDGDHHRVPQPEPLRHHEQHVLAHDHRQHLHRTTREEKASVHTINNGASHSPAEGMRYLPSLVRRGLQSMHDTGTSRDTLGDPQGVFTCYPDTKVRAWQLHGLCTRTRLVVCRIDAVSLELNRSGCPSPSPVPLSR